ncbi:uncharacterized protein CXorf38 homolog isoform X3 [Canis lupus baileyi]|uniref:uncharacterized protein CXorf38 homolog isoform X3 n=1 Tax=Canis lupus dingo TaxID=286419 RepID=UPI0006B3C8BB|nr:uncharacterized protein CXorf38 homolog isoform X3 [Canis lupus dingo]|eukprot:XP_013967441.1 uncharacterized protein CXorf38 homolog isoform X3 [Canis lupus familiaris]
MVLSELAARLNCTEYKNWVKAGHCLLLLRGCLQGFVAREVLAFHRGLLAATPSLGPRAACRSGSRCSPRARQFQPQCQVCAEWKREILKHHTNRNGDVHWGNCQPRRWPVDAWEVAKVIKCRNEIMHSSEMKVSSLWLRDFQMKIQNFLNEFKNIPEIVAAYTRIEQLLTSDWAVHIPAEDQRDGCEYETGVYLSESQVNEIEMELLKEKLQEIYLQAQEQDVLPEEILNQLEVVKEFLRNNEDLRNGLIEDIQKLDSLHLQHQKPDSEEPGAQAPKEKS